MLLSMFTENAHSLAMIAHSMKVIKAAVQHLNPLQTPVIILDQSLYALAKQIQWTLPEFDEDKFLAMMGGLHIEMAPLMAWRLSHQVIAASLHTLQKKKVYSAYNDKLEETEQSLTFED